MTRFVLCVVLVVSACKKGAKPDEATPGSGSAPAGSAEVVVVDAGAPAVDAPTTGSAAAATRPKEVDDLETTIAKLLSEPEGDARSKKTCGMLTELLKKSRAVAMNKPAAVDQAAWDAANEQIGGSLDGLGPYCSDDPPDDSVELPKLHKHVQALIALLPK